MTLRAVGELYVFALLGCWFCFAMMVHRIEYKADWFLQPKASQVRAICIDTTTGIFYLTTGRCPE